MTDDEHTPAPSDDGPTGGDQVESWRESALGARMVGGAMLAKLIIAFSLVLLVLVAVLLRSPGLLIAIVVATPACALVASLAVLLGIYRFRRFPGGEAVRAAASVAFALFCVVTLAEVFSMVRVLQLVLAKSGSPADTSAVAVLELATQGVAMAAYLFLMTGFARAARGIADSRSADRFGRLMVPLGVLLGLGLLLRIVMMATSPGSIAPLLLLWFPLAIAALIVIVRVAFAARGLGQSMLSYAGLETGSPEATDGADAEDGEPDEVGEDDLDVPGLYPALEGPLQESGPLGRLWRAIEPWELWLVFGLSLAVLVPGIWAYTLIDPWETHYGEVARRMLEDSDWVHLKWQNESFRSKPVLTMWLIAGSMKTMGVATDGGYSGELVSRGLALFAVRLPFVLFAVMGAMTTFWMLARLVSRRVAWLSVGILLSTPFYFMVARQAITDMPMVACLMGAMACFAMSGAAGESRFKPIWRGITALHCFLAVLVLVVGGQLVYYAIYFYNSPQLARGVNMPGAGWILSGAMLAGLVAFIVWIHWLQPVTKKRQVYMFWFYLLIGTSVLGKGPVAIGLAGAICLAYLALTWDWSRVFKVEVLNGRGPLIALLVAAPWHLAMFLKDGRGWVGEYFSHHMGKRLTDGVHGDRGTFDYFSDQLGVGMWPWVALLPVALATVALSANNRSSRGRMRLLVGSWTIIGFGLFAFSQTKFHHYVLPVVPAMAIVIALWIDDYLAGRVRRAPLAALVAVALAALIMRDIMGEQKQIIELFIYRYDRPWPSKEPWNLDLSDTLFVFGLLATVSLGAMAFWRARAWAVGALMISALAFGIWTMNGYMAQAAPHWGQGELHRTYYAERTIHGVEIKYFGLADLASDWDGDSDYRVESLLPTDFAEGLPMRVTLLVPGAGVPGDKVVLAGTVSSVGDDEFWIAVPAAERSKVAELISRGKRASSPPRAPWTQVDADRLIAWQLNWRGENFWSSGEIYGETEDTRTVFMHTNNKEFLKYAKAPERVGRTFYVVTEAGRANGMKGILPTDRAKETFEILDTSCNKFTLLRFTL